jgi:ribosomal protein S4
MILNKKNRYKPLYKQLIRLRENVQGRKKLLKFKKQKWSEFKFFADKKLNKWYKKYKPQDQMQFIVTKKPIRWLSLSKGSFRYTLLVFKRFSLFYGGFPKKQMKKYIKQTLNETKDLKELKLNFLKAFESKLDTVLYRSKFSISIRAARQLIVHGKIFVNGLKIKSPLYKLGTGDIITIDNNSIKAVTINVIKSNPWPITPKHLTVNYKTFQVIFGTIDYTVLSNNSNFNLDVERMLFNYPYH